MIIKTLVENMTTSCEIKAEHGLGIYIEALEHRILFDMGKSGLFLENAAKMGVAPELVDTAVISHGHYDHGGGLGEFVKINKKAKIYVSKRAFSKYYSDGKEGMSYIGLDAGLKANERVVLTQRHYVIDEGIELFSDVKDLELNPSGNADLYVEEMDVISQDDFSHEQNLIIKERHGTVLFSGCAHKGIVNILEHLRRHHHCIPTHVIGGFHLYSRSRDRYENIDKLEKIGQYLKKTGAMFYTCHCTGLDAYKRLKEILGERIEYLAAGTQIEI